MDSECWETCRGGADVVHLLQTGSGERGQLPGCSAGGSLGENRMLMSVLIESDSRSLSRLRGGGLFGFYY